jgi:hypothetical protein
VPLFDTEVTEQLSVVIAKPRAGDAEQALGSAFTDTAEGAVIVGSWLSVTVTSCVAVFERPLASTAVHVTVVLPSAYGEEPLFVTDATEQLSPVVAEPSETDDEVQRPAFRHRRHRPPEPRSTDPGCP